VFSLLIDHVYHMIKIMLVLLWINIYYVCNRQCMYVFNTNFNSAILNVQQIHLCSMIRPQQVDKIKCWSGPIKIFILYFTAVARVGADQKWKLLKLVLNTNQWINRSINLFTQLYQNHSLSRVAIKSGLYLDFILSNVVTFSSI
jgi:hypothetical protein